MAIRPVLIAPVEDSPSLFSALDINTGIQYGWPKRSVAQHSSLFGWRVSFSGQDFREQRLGRFSRRDLPLIQMR